MLQIKQLHAGYEDLNVLKGIDLELKPGSVSVLMGPNGAGKSTLLRAIFNLASITGGEIVYRGQDIVGLATHNLIELGIAYVPQGKINFSTLTVQENLLIGAYHLQDKKAMATNLETVLNVFPQLQDRLASRSYVLSGGQQQMVAMARALMNLPDLLLLDEPSLGLAPGLVKETFAHIRHLNQEFSVTVLIVEHNIKSVLAIADFGYIMAAGRIIAAGDTQNLRQSDALRQVFVGELE
ncbi:MAG: ABC transporter ATP-binding protein [Candidatus Andersenbacteria bacterium]|nr:ABC transporter ATP-binding protein [Candidatus Andersenbacteria bacterium]